MELIQDVPGAMLKAPGEPRGGTWPAAGPGLAQRDGDRPESVSGRRAVHAPRQLLWAGAVGRRAQAVKGPQSPVHGALRTCSRAHPR